MSQLKQPRFVFLHIHKTGGMSLRHLIYRQFSGGKVFTIAKVKDTNYFLELPEQQRNAQQLIFGHFQFSDSFIFPDKTNYFTMLREPVSRIISQFNYIYFNPKHPFHNTMLKKQFTLYDMLTKGFIKNFDNCLVRMLSGNVFKDFGAIDEADYKKALENFDRYFSHFGINEYFDESILMLSYELNWEFPYYANTNVTKHKKIDKVVAEKTLAALERCSRYDQLLYKHALEKFKQKLEIYGARLKTDKDKLKAGNAKRKLFLKLHYLLHENKIIGKHI